MMHYNVSEILNSDDFANYICESCDAIFEKRYEKCPSCGVSGSIKKIEIIPKLYDDDFSLFEDEVEEEEFHPKSASKMSAVDENSEFQIKVKKYVTGIDGFDALFDSGVIDGTLNLIIGKPGTGKTSFFLKIAELYAESGCTTLFISSEESGWQLTARVQKLKIKSSRLFVSSISDIDSAMHEISSLKPDIVILDSISGFFKKNIDAMQSSNIQIRECVADLARFAKEKGAAVFLTAQDMSSSTFHEFGLISNFFDSMLAFEAPESGLKTLKLRKSRDSAAGKSCVFRFEQDGARCISEFEYNSEIVRRLSLIPEKYSIGRVACFFIECGRLVYNELEALVGDRPALNPKWNVGGGIKYEMFDSVVSIVEKYLNIELRDKNISIKLLTEGEIHDPLFELPLALSIISSFYNISVSNKLVVIGHMELNGEIPCVELVNEYLEKLLSMGFKTIVTSNSNSEKFQTYSDKINLVNIQNIRYLYESLISLSSAPQKTKN